MCTPLECTSVKCASVEYSVVPLCYDCTQVCICAEMHNNKRQNQLATCTILQNDKMLNSVVLSHPLAVYMVCDMPRMPAS